MTAWARGVAYHGVITVFSDRPSTWLVGVQPGGSSSAPLRSLGEFLPQNRRVFSFPFLFYCRTEHGARQNSGSRLVIVLVYQVELNVLCPACSAKKCDSTR